MARASGSKVYLYFMKKGRQARHRIPQNSCAMLQLILKAQIRPRGYKTFPCSALLSMKFYLLISIKLLISTVVFLFSLAEYEIVYAYEYENANIVGIFISAEKISYSAELSMKTVLLPRGKDYSQNSLMRVGVIFQ